MGDMQISMSPHSTVAQRSWRRTRQERGNTSDAAVTKAVEKTSIERTS